MDSITSIISSFINLELNDFWTLDICKYPSPLHVRYSNDNPSVSMHYIVLYSHLILKTWCGVLVWCRLVIWQTNILEILIHSHHSSWVWEEFWQFSDLFWTKLAFIFPFRQFSSSSENFTTSRKSVTSPLINTFPSRMKNNIQTHIDRQSFPFSVIRNDY